MSHYLKIIRQAMVMSEMSNSSSYLENLSTLIQLVNRLTRTDLDINPRLLTADHFNRPNKAPCTYVKLYNHDNFSIGVFILADSYTMPIHDHPLIYGILKTISGTIVVQSYTAKTPPKYDEKESVDGRDLSLETIIAVREEQPKELTENSECAVVTPTEGNYHEITAVNGPAAFFDILNPPYVSRTHGTRKCTFYQRLFKRDTNGREQLYLQSIPCPSHYYCDSAEDFDSTDV